jgi:hypothetical protein
MSSVPYRLAIILENKCIKTQRQWCEPYIGSIPDIFTIYKDFIIRNMREENYSWICMKNNKYNNTDYKEEYGDKYSENADGFMIEYKDVKREKVEIVYISDTYSTGNYINGTLLQSTYPSINTIIFDRYRGYPSMLYNTNTLSLRNFIAIDSQGWDNPFEYIRAIPNIECALFEAEDCYMHEYSINSNPSNKVSWLDEFINTTIISPKLRLLLFFISSNDVYTAPPKWNTWFLKLPGPQTYYWVVYEKYV